MVSISREFSGGSGGATFFNEPNLNADTEPLQSYTVVHANFKPLPTIPVFSIHILYTVALQIMAIVYASKHPDMNSRCKEYFIIIYMHVAWWFLTLILDLWSNHHHHKLRIAGYLDAYNDLGVLHRIPLFILSLWTCTIMFIQTLMEQYYPDDFADKCLKGGAMSPFGYICAFVTVEVCILLGINVSYIVKVAKYNKSKLPPDVIREDWDTSNTNNDWSRVNDFLEKQADYIRYLRGYNDKLSEKLMVLSSQKASRRGSEP